MVADQEGFDGRTLRLRGTVRRLVRRGARRNLARMLEKIRPEDVSAILDGLTPSEQLGVFELVLAEYPDTAGQILVAMEPATMLNLLEQLEPEQIAGVVEKMPSDDSVFIVESLPAVVKERVLELFTRHESEELQAQLTYSDDSAGRIMTTEFFSLPEGTTAGEAISRIQELGEVEMIFYLYLVNDAGDLVGVISLRQLLMTHPEKTLDQIMSRSVIKVTTETDQEEVARLASRYDLLAIPVTDEVNRLVGIITVDDVIDIVQEEADEDFLKMVGSSDDELLYRERSWRVAKIRLPWILFNLGGLFLTGLIFDYFEATLQELIFLVIFAPLIMGMGGNIGSQTSTIAVRGLATGRLTSGWEQIRGFLGQQLRVGMLLGLACAPLAALGALALKQNPALSGVVAVSLFLSITLAALNGSLVPLLFERFGIDPAVAAGPMVTTTSDMVGIVVYFGCATAMLRWL